MDPDSAHVIIPGISPAEAIACVTAGSDKLSYRRIGIFTRGNVSIPGEMLGDIGGKGVV